MDIFSAVLCVNLCNVCILYSFFTFFFPLTLAIKSKESRKGTTNIITIEDRRLPT